MRQKYRRKHKRPDGFDSPLELEIWKQLPKARTKYEPELLYYMIPHKYKPDFVITKPDGRKVYLEVKGYLRWEDQRKMRAVKEYNPDLDIRFYFPKDNKVQTSNMTNSEWCVKYGFPCAIGKLPKGWFR
jgi:hypothetical protein